MTKMGNNKVVLFAILLVSCIARACGSSIPMWEFLTREEKMGHLYRVFNQQVDEYCTQSSMPDCSKNLLVTGLKNLATFDDDRLDEMDIYQRNAKDIIWRAIIGNSLQVNSPNSQQSLENLDNDPLAFGDNELSQETSSSNDYTHPGSSGPYLSGPMVIRVYPDGRPVPNNVPLPKDEDIDDISNYKSALPTLRDIETSKKGFYLPSASEKNEKYSQVMTSLTPPKRNHRYNYYNYNLPSRYYPRASFRISNGNYILRERFY